MDKLINNLVNYLSSFTINLDLGNLEINQITENFEDEGPKLGYTFFIEDKKKLYQQVF